jgi:hypothetical protein
MTKLRFWLAKARMVRLISFGGSRTGNMLAAKIAIPSSIVVSDVDRTTQHMQRIGNISPSERTLREVVLFFTGSKLSSTIL